MIVRAGFALALLVAANATAAPPPDWQARYDVTFGENEQGTPRAAIAATLTWAHKGQAHPESVVVGMAEDEFPGGYGSYVRELTPAAEVISAPDGRLRLPVPADGVVRFRYRVVLEHDPKNWGPGPDEAPYRFDGGAFWTGRALFITADHSRAELTFSSPAASIVSVSFDPVPGRAGTYRASDESRLRESFLLVGRQRTTELKVGDAAVTLALGGQMAGSMPVVEQAVRAFLLASEAIFHGAPPARVLVAGNLGTRRGSLDGGVFGSDISFLADEPLTPSNEARWRPFLCHEIFHLWNGRVIDFPAGQQYWLTEGATEYEAHLLPVRLGASTTEAFLATMAGKAARYLEAAGSVGLLAAGDEKFLNNALVYDGGTLAAMVLDVTIRSRTSNRKSLDDLLRTLYDRARARKGKGLTADDVESAATKLAGDPIHDFFRRYIRGNEPLPLADALKLAGLELHVEVAELPETMAVVGDLLRCPSVTVVDEGLKILVSKSETIHTGDIIVGAEGGPIRTFDDLRRLFKDRPRGSHIAVKVIRDGARTELDVLLAGKADDPIEHSRHTTVTIDVAATASPEAAAVRQSLLGPTVR